MNILKKVLRSAYIFVLIGSISSNVSAALYERVNLVYGVENHLQILEVNDASEYRITLTDFAFTNPLKELGVILTSATEQYASMHMESDLTYGGYGTDASIWGISPGSNKLGGHTWGQGQKQMVRDVYLEAGTYYLALHAKLADNWMLNYGHQIGMYGVEVIATPIPASIVLLFSGLAVLGFLNRRRRAQ